MGHVLGLIGSARRWGNSELLVRQVLQGTLAEGTTAQMVRLTDLRLDSCTGCMRCVLGQNRASGGKRCPVDDDMVWLADTIQAADRLVLAAPTYFLGPAAVIKMVLDRLLLVTSRLVDNMPWPRPAVTLVTAGLKEWRGVTLPYLNALAAAFGYRPIESLTAIAPGPGEVLLNEPLMASALAAGHRLGRGELQPAPAPRNVCPICQCDAFSLKGSLAICPICGLEASVEQDEAGFRLQFDPDLDLANGEHRWTPEGLRRHMVGWVMATGPRFMAKRGEIKELRRPFRDVDIDWLRPPVAEH
jgi:multimeric flavodoxin WrbA